MLEGNEKKEIYIMDLIIKIANGFLFGVGFLLAMIIFEGIYRIFHG